MSGDEDDEEGETEVVLKSNDVASCQVQECSIMSASSQVFVECLLDLLASHTLLQLLNIKLSWYQLQNLKFLFLWLPCGSLYSTSGAVVQPNPDTPTQCVSGARGSGGADLMVHREQIFSPHLFPGLTQRALWFEELPQLCFPISRKWNHREVWADGFGSVWCLYHCYCRSESQALMTAMWPIVV